MSRHELQREIHDEQGIRFALAWAEDMIRRGLRGGPVRLSLGRRRRTLDQNARLWPMLQDVAKQVDWHGQKLSKEDWKEVFTASLRQQRAVPGIDGGFVILGTSTRRMTVREFSDLIELIFAFGAEHDVEWSEPAQRTIHQSREVA